MTVTIRQATIGDLDALTPLFDAYRQFYEQPEDLDGARQFLHDRFAALESVIFLAELGGRAVGFTQLYPSFSSTRLKRIYVLNDLFVTPDSRGLGVGHRLLTAAAEFGRRAGAFRLVLATAITNTTAQAVYERTGWVRDETFLHYGRLLS